MKGLMAVTDHGLATAEQLINAADMKEPLGQGSGVSVWLEPFGALENSGGKNLFIFVFLRNWFCSVKLLGRSAGWLEPECECRIFLVKEHLCKTSWD